MAAGQLQDMLLCLRRLTMVPGVDGLPDHELLQRFVQNRDEPARQTHTTEDGVNSACFS